MEEVIASGRAAISWINVGEVFYIEAREAGETTASAAVETLVRSVRVEEVDSALVLEAARIKAAHPLSYADAFAVALAERLRAPLLTGDPEILALDRSVSVIDPRG